MSPPDPRMALWRLDLAATRLRGVVDAQLYAEPVAWQAGAAIAPMRERPDAGARLASQALFGERVDVLEMAGGWAFGQLATDDYVGYLPVHVLTPPGPAPTHKVAALRTYLHPAPDLKSPAGPLLSIGSLLAVAGVEGAYARLADGRFVFAGHISAVGDAAHDPASCAERFIGSPYLWGGRTSLGLDCSALVQLAFAACGLVLPRDSDLQRAALGGGTPLDDGACDREGCDLAPGDLLFWPGHVAMADGAGGLVHANAHHMAVVREPLGAALARIGAALGRPHLVREPANRLRR